MPKHIKVLLIFAVIVLALMIAKNIKGYYTNEKIKEMIFKEEAKTLNSFIVAFRKVYQKEFIEQKIPINEKTVHLLPVHTMLEISETFSHLMDAKTIIRTISDNPRNPKNMANARELQVINRFKQTKSKEPYFEIKGSKIFQVTPMYIEQSCLKCHGEKQSAPESIQDRYDTAYGYKLGDFRGAISIEISKEAIMQSLDEDYQRQIKIAILVYLTFMTAVYFLIKIIRDNESEYTSQLEERVVSQIKSIKSKERLLFQQSKLASMGEMMANIAHQWRQPLSVITTIASGVKIQKELDILDINILDNSCDSIIKQAQFLSNTINDFRDFLKTDKTKSLFNLHNTIINVQSIVSAIMSHNNIQMIYQNDYKKTEICGVENELLQAILNILNNAKDVLVEKQTDDERYIFISIQKSDVTISISITDNAFGIAPDVIGRIFEPYFTTKHQSQGTGLGLYMTHNIVVGFGGEISVYNEEYEYLGKKYSGAKFVIELPLGCL